MNPTPPTAASWTFAENLVAEDELLADARARAADLGCQPVGSGTAAALRVLASAIDAKSVVEVGTGTGVSGLSLLRGMRADGVLTSVDIEAEHQRVARDIFSRAGITASRARLIVGRALEVLPRLTDGGYDLVFVDGDKVEYPALVEEGARLLRSGGILAIDNALWHDRVADPAQRDPETVTIRGVVDGLRTDERFRSVSLLPVGDGLLVGVLA